MTSDYASKLLCPSCCPKLQDAPQESGDSVKFRHLCLDFLCVEHSGDRCSGRTAPPSLWGGFPGVVNPSSRDRSTRRFPAATTHEVHITRCSQQGAFSTSLRPHGLSRRIAPSNDPVLHTFHQYTFECHLCLRTFNVRLPESPITHGVLLYRVSMFMVSRAHTDCVQRASVDSGRAFANSLRSRGELHLHA